MHIKDLCCHHYCFAIVSNVITENARRGRVNEILYADDLVLISKDMENLKERFWNWKMQWEVKV